MCRGGVRVSIHAGGVVSIRATHRLAALWHLLGPTCPLPLKLGVCPLLRPHSMAGWLPCTRFRIWPSPPCCPSARPPYPSLHQEPPCRAAAGPFPAASPGGWSPGNASGRVADQAWPPCLPLTRLLLLYSHFWGQERPSTRSVPTASPLYLEGLYLLPLRGSWGGMLPGSWCCLQQALAPHREALEAGAGLAPAQDARGSMVFRQGQDVVALVTHHLQQSLKRTNISERRRSSLKPVTITAPLSLAKAHQAAPTAFAPETRVAALTVRFSNFPPRSCHRQVNVLNE